MKRVAVRNPYTGKLVKYVTLHTKKDALSMLQKAKKAFEQLRQTPRYVRSDALIKVSQSLKKQKKEIAKTLMQEAGKPISLAEVEVDRAIFTFQYAAEEIKRFGVQAIPMDIAPHGANRFGYIKRFPVGPILGITPFNFPLNLVVHKVAPALAVGNPIIIKPNILTPLSALKLKELVDETDLPRHCMQVTLLPGAEAEVLVKHKDVPIISFTGSAKVGWHIKKEAFNKKVTLELGGNASCVLAEDGNVNGFVERVVAGAFGYAGQSCISVQHALIHSSHYEEVKKKILNRVKRVMVGNPSDKRVLSGPVINDVAADRIVGWIDEAKGKGAKVLIGAERKGKLISPTVIEKAPKSSHLYKEEIFGPVLVISSFKKDEDAIKHINGSRYGLQCGVYTSDFSRMQNYFDHVDVGGVMINEVPTYRIDHMPYGGVKDSGFGREGLIWAMDEMTEPRIMVAQNP